MKQYLFILIIEMCGCLLWLLKVFVIFGFVFVEEISNL